MGFTALYKIILVYNYSTCIYTSYEHKMIIRSTSVMRDMYFTAKFVQNRNRCRYNGTLLKRNILWTRNVLLCLNTFPLV